MVKLTNSMMLRIVCLSLALAASTFAHAGPGAKAGQPTIPSLQTLVAGTHLFHGVGVVTAVDPEGGVVTIDHEAIPGLMDAMMMAFKTLPKSLTIGLKPGDRVEFEVDDATYTLHALKKTR